MTNDDLKQIDTIMDKKLTAAEARLKEEIGNFMEDTLLPLINERFDAVDERLEETAADIGRIDRKFDRLLDANLDHERRIKNIESIPVIAHELKRRKHK